MSLKISIVGIRRIHIVISHFTDSTIFRLTNSGVNDDLTVIVIVTFGIRTNFLDFRHQIRDAVVRCIHTLFYLAHELTQDLFGFLSIEASGQFFRDAGLTFRATDTLDAAASDNSLTFV